MSITQAVTSGIEATHEQHHASRGAGTTTEGPREADDLGNFPQAFSHLALIEAAARIIVAERLEEMNGG